MFQLHVTPIKCSHFLANMAKKFALVYVLCAYTRVTTCLTRTHVYHSGTRDTRICSCSGLARCTKCRKIQNDRKYKHQFVFQVYNTLFTKIGWEERVYSPIFFPGGRERENILRHVLGIFLNNSESHREIPSELHLSTRSSGGEAEGAGGQVTGGGHTDGLY